MIDGMCGHCGATMQLYQDFEDGDITCLVCGWREPPKEIPDLPKRLAGVDRWDPRKGIPYGRQE